MTDDQYWAEYSNLQRVKHELIRRYLGGWFAKLGSWAGKVIYLDTHAGRGKHLAGQLGSPLVALDTLLRHSHRDRLLQHCEFVFVFIERDKENLEKLKGEIASLGALPPGIRIHPVSGDCFSELGALVASLRSAGSAMAPAFVFADPYGFKVPAALLRDLMRAGRVELFVNIIWRELAMALAQSDVPGMAKLLDEIFDGPEWRTRANASDFDARADQAINLLAEKIGARWKTYIRMLGDNNVTRYLLVHLTNHDAGRDLMKESMWAVCPDGGFYARKTDDPSQQWLITPKPDLAPLREWIVTRLKRRPQRWRDLADTLRVEVWRDKHLTDVLRQMRRNGEIKASGYSGRFGPSANPLIKVCVTPERET